MKTKLELQQLDPAINLDQLASETGLIPEVVRYLCLRGFDTKEKIERMLDFNLQDLRNVRDMKDAEAFLSALQKAYEENLSVTIYGDYDGDGIMGTFILWSSISRVSKTPIHWFINNRFREGYGMNVKGVRRLLDLYPDTKLIITVDNGIKALEGIQYALNKGIQVIVSDHHGQSEGESLPDCPVVCEKRLDEKPDGEWFCGAELARRLMEAWYADNGWNSDADQMFLSNLIAYSGLATITDSIQMNPANHYICRKGLDQIQLEKDLVWKVLRQETGAHDVDEDTVGFQYGPMINAPGRMEGDVSIVMEALLSSLKNDEEGCRKAVKEMMRLNESRKETAFEDDQIAFEQIREKGYDHDSIIVLTDDRFQEGINGLTAGHIVETLGIPAIVLSPLDQDPDIYKGSARSVEGFNIFESLNECRDLLLGFGGHPMAAGLSVARDRIPDLRQRLQKIASENVPEKEQIRRIDFEMTSDQISPSLIAALNRCRPFGYGFERPTIGIESVIESYRVLKDRHLKFDIESGTEVLWWNSLRTFKKMTDEVQIENAKISVIGYPSFSIYKGRIKTQIYADEVFVTFSVTEL